MIEIHWLLQMTQSHNTSMNCWISNNENEKKRERKIIKYVVHGLTFIFIIIYMTIAFAMHTDII